MQETLHLTKSKANRRRFEASVENINQKKDLSNHHLIED